MFFIRVLLVLLFLLCSDLAVGQENFTGYLEPGFSMNYGVATNYSHNWELAQRSYFFDGDFKLKARQLDITHFSKLKIGYDQSVAFGVRYRFRNVFETDEENELRFTQQYNFKHQRSSLRYGHRFRAEQRITPSLTTYRFRYRFAIDLPLNGEKLDVGEPYLITSTESLLSTARTKVPEYVLIPRQGSKRAKVVP